MNEDVVVVVINYRTNSKLKVSLPPCGSAADECQSSASPTPLKSPSASRTAASSTSASRCSGYSRISRLSAEVSHPSSTSSASHRKQRAALLTPLLDDIDPTKVTLFSESAGGYSIKQLLANPPSPLPFRAAIMESQQSDNTGDGPANYETVVAHFGCATAASPIDCLRVVSGTAIQSYIETAEGGLDFPPVANDGTFVMSTQASITDGEFAAVPILIGTNKDEFRVFLDMLGLDTAGGPANETAVVDEIATYASALGLPAFNATGVESELLDAYSADAGDDAFELLSR